MIVMRVIMNAVIMAAEIAAVVAIAWAAWQEPMMFAIGTGGLAFAAGLILDYQRITHEAPFYFDQPLRGRSFAIAGTALIDSAAKGLLAGMVALVTFSGTDAGRLWWVALAFALTVFAGTSLLRALSLRFGARPLRWGYFRLAAPLGLLFAFALGLMELAGWLPVASLTDIGRKALLETPAKPSIGQVSELLFLVKQYFDWLMVSLLSAALGPEVGRFTSLFVSVNVLSGFVAAIYATMIAAAVREAERIVP